MRLVGFDAGSGCHTLCRVLSVLQLALSCWHVFELDRCLRIACLLLFANSIWHRVCHAQVFILR